MKRCNICGEDKPLDYFTKDRSKADGRHTLCKSCKNSRRKKAETPEEKQYILEYQRTWRKNNPEKLKAKSAKDCAKYKTGEYKRKIYQYQSPSPEKAERRRILDKARYAKRRLDPELHQKRLEYNCLRKGRLRKAIPSKLDTDQRIAIRDIYRECRSITKETGIKHHVDHIEPLFGKTSCGLHVPWNLQVIPAIENHRKSNKLLS